MSFPQHVMPIFLLVYILEFSMIKFEKHQTDLVRKEYIVLLPGRIKCHFFCVFLKHLSSQNGLYGVRACVPAVVTAKAFGVWHFRWRIYSLIYQSVGYASLGMVRGKGARVLRPQELLGSPGIVPGVRKISHPAPSREALQ